MSARPLIVIRPEPGCSATLSAARGLGLEVHGFPLFAVEPVVWDVPEAAGFDGLLAGSANVFRHGGEGLARLTALPVHAVGAATAEAARAAGFRVAQVGEGGLQVLAGRLAPGNYLRLAGEDHVPLDPAAGARIESRIVYAARALPMPSALIALLSVPCVVALHSGEAARHFAAECKSHGVQRQHVTIAALAPRIAAMAGSGWGDVGISAQRTDTAMLELAERMCQTV